MLNHFILPTFSRTIKVQRLKWLGHVQRMIDEKEPREALNGKPEERMDLKRQNCRWFDEVDSDLRKNFLRKPCGMIWSVAKISSQAFIPLIQTPTDLLPHSDLLLPKYYDARRRDKQEAFHYGLKLAVLLSKENENKRRNI
ncbi:hypothetical protein C0J52_27291 [Blattella germanica]|nr:hypothetical protein C0J52_27291 [Blattella germanica]